MSKKRRHLPPANGRMLWGGRMWDRHGRQFEMFRELDRTEADSLLDDDDVEAAMASCSAPLRWIEPADRRRAWRVDILPRLHDNPNWQPPPGEPGTLPFVPELWQEVGGTARAVVFNDRD